ncbi:CBS-domain-containing membrane protein [Halohasta litchfieldiae]|jgi:nucleotide-binding universal stress UspA family protein|uniref:Universal stress protein family protein n=1 Tax=Halohasta litchfieldiae TaxID=1073996 RepID=A0A1H6UR32_9EURY|nr:HPP family protein [Halohasta litchfieldiae]ATW88424.1 CBS-domain-containing membrane protein [Halohasta litchfieldiae]SEI94863.1 Universal stress protein family protein [Halohasta litchfieldiae]
MLELLVYWYQSTQRRLRRFERREIRAFRHWLEDPENLLHLSALVIVPLLVGGVTWLANASPVVSFLVYPPLAAGAYTLFSNPGGRYASPRRFVGGISAGAICGWLVLNFTGEYWTAVPLGDLRVNAGAAALGIFLTGVVTWAFSLEEPSAYSSALLVLVTGSNQLAYVGGIVVSSLIVAGVFLVWRRQFYEERAQYLFQSTHGDDQILVPIRSDASESLVLFAARLAAAHEAGKIVLMQTVSTETIAETEQKVEAEVEATTTEPVSEEDVTRTAEVQITETARQRLEALQELVESTVDVPCEFVVVAEDGSAGDTILETSAAENCDLIVSPYEADEGTPSRFVRTLLNGPTDTVVFRPASGRTTWHRILVMVRGPGEQANTMLNFAHRLVSTGRIAACSCISNATERRNAETMLDNLVESFAKPIETRIGYGPVEEFLQANASHYDLVIVGASNRRSVASRFFSTPTFEKIHTVDCDLAIVHRGR